MVTVTTCVPDRFLPETPWEAAVLLLSFSVSEAGK